MRPAWPCPEQLMMWLGSCTPERGTTVQSWRQGVAQWPNHHNDPINEEIGSQMAQTIFGQKGYLTERLQA